MLPPGRIWDPEVYQGGRVEKRYFEGWYFKQADASGSRILAIIPGVSYSADGVQRHSFVQVVPAGGVAHYFAFPADDFVPGDGPSLALRIGPNTFGRDGIHLDLRDGQRVVRGDLAFGPWSPWPVTLFSPGIMGPFRFVPRMETYHGVLSMDHAVSGTVGIDGESVTFDGGRGYAEKDWGRSFPSSWIWAQSNHFEEAGTSLTLSVARIPWMGGAFVGSIAGLLEGGRLHRFATYTSARLTCIETGANEARLSLSDGREQLDVALRGRPALVLKAPVLGSMEGRDAESLGGSIDVTLRSVRGGRASVLYRGTGQLAGIEIMNDRDELGRIPCPRAATGQ